MNTNPVLRATLLALTTCLLAACGDVLDAPEDNLPPPVDLGSGTNPPPATSSIPTKAQLAGTWLVVREDGVAVPSNVVETLTYFSDDTYLFGGAASGSDCNPTPANAGTFANYDANGNGVEFGELDYNETTGVASASSSTFFIDSNGDCGPHEPSTGATQDVFRFTLANGVLRATFEADNNVIELERVTRGSGVVGSWYFIGDDEDLAEGATSNGGAPVVLTLLPDGQFLLLCADDQNGLADDDPGAQVGRYRLDADHNLTVSNLISNTSSCAFGSTSGTGDNGVSNEKLVIAPSGQLEYRYFDISDAEDEVVRLAPLPLTPRFNTTALNGSWFLDANQNDLIEDEADVFLAYFGADGKYISGGSRNDPTCNSAYAGTGLALEADGNGYEVGSFKVDATTGRVRFNVSSETDGACGAYDRTRPETRSYLLSLSSNRANVVFMNRDGESEPVSSISAVPSTANSIYGPWRGTTNPTGNVLDDFLVAYFQGNAGSIYFAVDANPSSTCTLTDPGPRGGVEFNTVNGLPDSPGYEHDGSTLCQTRFDPNAEQTITFSSDFLSYTDNQEAGTEPATSFVYRKLSNP